jgi:hypothetical protein
MVLRDGVWADPMMKPLANKRVDLVSRVRIFAQMYAFQAHSMYCALFSFGKNLVPRKVIVTIRYTDWWNWEEDAPLSVKGLRPHDITGLYWPASVEKFVLELETREGKKKELESIIEEMKSWEYGKNNGTTLKMERDEPVREWTWNGPTVFEKGVTYGHHPEGDTMKYVVKALTWRAGKGGD